MHPLLNRSAPVSSEAVTYSGPPGRWGASVTEPWLSADGIAAHLGVTKDPVYTWIAEKNMPAHKISRLWKFQVSEVDKWVRSGGAAASGSTEPD